MARTPATTKIENGIIPPPRRALTETETSGVFFHKKNQVLGVATGIRPQNPNTRFK